MTASGPKTRLIVNDASVELRSTSNTELIWSLQWSEVIEIVGWKDDAFAYDIICIGLRINGSSTSAYLRCDEEVSGWQEFIAEMEKRFTLRIDWWPQVAFPAFSKNRTLLWEKKL